MNAYLVITLLALLIFLCISDVVEVVTRAAAEWERAKDFSKRNLVR